MRKTEIRVESAEAFFERGRKYGALADSGARIPDSRVVAFEDVESLVAVLTGQRILLIRQLKEASASISDLAKRLKRDRSAVTRDVKVLERLGVVQVSERPLPGHGRQKWVSPIAQEIRLTAKLT